MKATGIVRRIDDLGRVVIPKEIRRTMRIREGDPLEIYTTKDGEVIFKKYSLMGDIDDLAGQFCEALSKNINGIVAVTDRDSVISVAGGGKRELLEKRISSQLEKIMEDRGVYEADGQRNMFAICERYEPTDGLRVLPAGTYLCADCTEDTRESAKAELLHAAKERGLSPAFVLHVVVLSGITRWFYRLQVPIGLY